MSIDYADLARVYGDPRRSNTIGITASDAGVPIVRPPGSYGSAYEHELAKQQEMWQLRFGNVAKGFGQIGSNLVTAANNIVNLPGNIISSFTKWIPPLVVGAVVIGGLILFLRR